MKDYYAILGVKENADAQEIKKAYRKLVKIYHPDVVKEDKEKTRRMYAIQEAYQCLSKEESRKKYDESRKNRQKNLQAMSRQGRKSKTARVHSPHPAHLNSFLVFRQEKGWKPIAVNHRG